MYKLKGYQGFFSSLLGICLLSFASLLWVAPSAAESGALAKAGPKPSQNFTVSTNNGLVSVTATEAPLKDVVERIGQALGIEVQAQIGTNEKVTAEFNDLPLEQVIKRLSENYAYRTDRKSGTLSKLFIYPRGEPVQHSRGVAKASANETGRRASSAEPFKFTFDPAEFIQEGGD